MSRVDTAGTETGWMECVCWSVCAQRFPCTHRDVEGVHLGVFVGSKEHTCP